jgi:hypothetical protein
MRLFPFALIVAIIFAGDAVRNEAAAQSVGEAMVGAIAQGVQSDERTPPAAPATAASPKATGADSKDPAHDSTGDVWLRCALQESWNAQPGGRERSVSPLPQDPLVVHGISLDRASVYVVNTKMKYFFEYAGAGILPGTLEFPGTKSKRTEFDSGPYNGAIVDTRVTRQAIKVTDDAITAYVEGTTLDGIYTPPRSYKWTQEYSINRQTLTYADQDGRNGTIDHGTDGQCKKIDPKPVKEWPVNAGRPQF